MCVNIVRENLFMLPRIEIMFSLAKTKTSVKYSISDSLVNSQAVFVVLWFPISLNPFRQIRKLLSMWNTELNSFVSARHPRLTNSVLIYTSNVVVQ